MQCKLNKDQGSQVQCSESSKGELGARYSLAQAIHIGELGAQCSNSPKRRARGKNPGKSESFVGKLN